MSRFKVLFIVFIISACQTANHNGSLTGPTRGLNPKLVRNLKTMSAHFGKPVKVTSHGGCRKRGNRRAPNSLHKISNGCKAADIRISGISRQKILKYWNKKFGGGKGYYCGKSFVHVDIGPNRSWRWC